MSQSILIKGTYRNNKTFSVGMFNPKNNRVFKNEELSHLDNVLIEFKDKLNKFKKIEIIAHVEGKQVLKDTTNDFKMLNINEVINYTNSFIKA